MNRKGLAVLSVSAVVASLTTMGAAHQSHAARKKVLSIQTAGIQAEASELFGSQISADKNQRSKDVTPIQHLNVTVLSARGSSLSDLPSRSASLESLQQETKRAVLRARTNSVSALDFSPAQQSPPKHSSSNSDIHNSTAPQKKTVHKAKVKNSPSAKVSKKSVDHKASRPAGRDLRAASIALHYSGVPYKWGGSSPSGFDCSGLVEYVYARVGISLPHSSYAMFQDGSPVSRRSLRVGDMVFFDTDGKGASHVGIYVGGNRFISAVGSSVRVSDLSGYWAQHYIGARRP